MIRFFSDNSNNAGFSEYNYQFLKRLYRESNAGRKTPFKWKMRKNLAGFRGTLPALAVWVQLYLCIYYQ